MFLHFIGWLDDSYPIRSFENLHRLQFLEFYDVLFVLEVIIDNLSPTKAFINVDLPTFGFPMMFTKPALCDISTIIYGTKVVISS
jgi:hypothetical protein